jgi:hypothetical protein
LQLPVIGRLGNSLKDKWLTDLEQWPCVCLIAS